MASESQTTADKIRNFGSLPVGWHYGEGIPAPPIAIDLALRVEAMFRTTGYPETDAFPCGEGQILVTGYLNGCSVSIEVRDDGRFIGRLSLMSDQTKTTRTMSITGSEWWRRDDWAPISSIVLSDVRPGEVISITYSGAYPTHVMIERKNGQ